MRNKVILMIVAVALMALPAIAQNFGKPYKPNYNQAQKQQVVATTTAPSATFQSTCTMTGSGSTYSANPTLNADGTANAPAYASGGPRRLPGTQQEDEEGDLPEGTETRPDDPNPLGDAVLPLLLMSLAFCGYLYLRRKRSAA